MRANLILEGITLAEINLIDVNKVKEIGDSNFISSIFFNSKINDYEQLILLKKCIDYLFNNVPTHIKRYGYYIDHDINNVSLFKSATDVNSSTLQDMKERVEAEYITIRIKNENVDVYNKNLETILIGKNWIESLKKEAKMLILSKKDNGQNILDLI